MAGRKPEYWVKARSGRKDADGNDYLMHVGAAWRFNNDGDGMTVQINALPVQFDGFLLISPQSPPKDDER